MGSERVSQRELLLVGVAVGLVAVGYALQNRLAETGRMLALVALLVGTVGAFALIARDP